MISTGGIGMWTLKIKKIKNGVVIVTVTSFFDAVRLGYCTG
jgi:hypothetical protein